MNSFEYYQHLLRSHDFLWRSTEDARYIDKYIDEEKQIEKLRQEFDPRNELFNQFSPYKKN